MKTKSASNWSAAQSEEFYGFKRWGANHFSVDSEGFVQVEPLSDGRTVRLMDVVDEVIRMFQFRKNRNTLKFQERLVQQEQDKFVDHRFNKALVHRLTNLSGEELDKFMQQYRPTFVFTQYSNDYDFQSYIKESFEIYKSRKAF